MWNQKMDGYPRGRERALCGSDMLLPSLRYEAIKEAKRQGVISKEVQEEETACEKALW